MKIGQKGLSTAAIVGIVVTVVVVIVAVAASAVVLLKPGEGGATTTGTPTGTPTTTTTTPTPTTTTTIPTTTTAPTTTSTTTTTGTGTTTTENASEYVIKEYLAGTYSGYKSPLVYGETNYTVCITYDLVNLVNGVTLPFRVRLWNDGVGVTHNASSTVNINGFNYAEWDSATSSAYMSITLTQQAAVYDDQGGSFVSDNFGWLSSEVCHGDLLIDTQDSTIKSVANSIRSASKTPYEVAKSVAIWMADNEQITYGKQSGLASNVNKTPSEVLSTKEGDCIELSTLYASVCRAAGVPTRIVWAFTENKTSPFGHVWTEFYDGEKWIPVDMTDMIMYHSGPSGAALGPVSDWFGFVDARDIAIYVENSSSTGLSQIYSDSKNFEDAMPIYTRTGSGTILETAKLEIYNTGRRELVFEVSSPTDGRS